MEVNEIEKLKKLKKKTIAYGIAIATIGGIGFGSIQSIAKDFFKSETAFDTWDKNNNDNNSINIYQKKR